MEPDKLISEARARLIWGEPALSVRAFLVSNGISDTVADAKVKEFSLARNREVRSIGIRNVLIGVVLTGAGGIGIYLLLHVYVKALGVLVLAGLYGVWKLATGIIYLVRPQSERRSVPDIAKSDIID